MGHWFAVVSRSANGTPGAQRQLRLSKRIRQVSGVLHRLAAAGAGCEPRIARRRRGLYELYVSTRVLRQPLRGGLVPWTSALHRADTHWGDVLGAVGSR